MRFFIDDMRKEVADFLRELAADIESDDELSLRGFQVTPTFEIYTNGAGNNVGTRSMSVEVKLNVATLEKLEQLLDYES